MSSYTPTGLPFESRTHRCEQHPVHEDPDRCNRCDHARTARRLDRERGEYSRHIIDLANGDTSPRGSLSGRNTNRVRELYNERERNTDRSYEDLYTRDLNRSSRDLRDILTSGSERSSTYGGSGDRSGYGSRYGSGYGSDYGSGYGSSRDYEHERDGGRDFYDGSRFSNSRENYGSSKYSGSRDGYGSTRGSSSSRNGYGNGGLASFNGRSGLSSGSSFRRDSSTRYPGLPGDEGYSRGGRRGAYSTQGTIVLDEDGDNDY